jgi:hypothetical protein
MNTVKCSSQFRPVVNEQLTASPELMNWLSRLPDDAVLQHVTFDKGNQRDPWVLLVGLLATWEEER